MHNTHKGSYRTGMVRLWIFLVIPYLRTSRRACSGNYFVFVDVTGDRVFILLMNLRDIAQEMFWILDLSGVFSAQSRKWYVTVTESSSSKDCVT
jgi:hypothetical protein